LYVLVRPEIEEHIYRSQSVIQQKNSLLLL